MQFRGFAAAAESFKQRERKRASGTRTRAHTHTNLEKYGKNSDYFTRFVLVTFQLNTQHTRAARRIRVQKKIQELLRVAQDSREGGRGRHRWRFEWRPFQTRQRQQRPVRRQPRRLCCCRVAASISPPLPDGSARPLEIVALASCSCLR